MACGLQGRACPLWGVSLLPAQRMQPITPLSCTRGPCTHPGTICWENILAALPSGVGRKPLQGILTLLTARLTGHSAGAGAHVRVTTQQTLPASASADTQTRGLSWPCSHEGRREPRPWVPAPPALGSSSAGGGSWGTGNSCHLDGIKQGHTVWKDVLVGAPGPLGTSAETGRPAGTEAGSGRWRVPRTGSAAWASGRSTPYSSAGRGQGQPVAPPSAQLFTGHPGQPARCQRGRTCHHRAALSTPCVTPIPPQTKPKRGVARNQRCRVASPCPRHTGLRAQVCWPRGFRKHRPLRRSL